MNDNTKVPGRISMILGISKMYFAGLLLIVLPHKDRREVVDGAIDQLKDKHPGAFERFQAALRTITNK